MSARTLSLCLGMLGALVLSLNLRVSAASRLTEDFGDLVKRAAIVVEVEVGDSQEEANAKIGMPLTISSAKVLRVLRGEAAKSIQIERFGGQQGAATLIVPGQATLSAGDHAFVLLMPSPLNNGRYRVLGGDAGCVLNETAPNGDHILRRATGRFDYYIADEASVSGFVARQAQTLPDNEFDALVGALIKTGRPVLTVASAPKSDVAPKVAVLPLTSIEPVQIPSPAEAPLFFKVGIFLACVTLAWAATRLVRTLARNQK